MSKCKKAKNPCKICLGPVTQKTGLQCQGACECWVHYTCLNYTPGKIKDIKAGIIKVTCPCPDCKSALPKEYRTDEPFSCSNMKCPAHHPPRCENTACPINSQTPDKMNQTSAVNAPPLAKCGAECKQHSHSKLPDAPGTAPRLQAHGPHPGGMPQHPQMQHSPSNSGLGMPKCPPGCSSSTDISGDYGQSPIEGLPSMGALEQMCNTVGQLTNQINCLMNKMRQVVEEKNRTGGGNLRGCSQKGPKALCPKPCFCPGNPGTRN